MDIKIDFVVSWVDDSDPKWRELYHFYRGGEVIEDKGRYRDWDFFQYWFRAVERYAPWVNKVFLVTNGTNPKWINPNCSKLVLVDHKDFIPEDHLPTFNTRAIELNLHRIKDLSEHFVYFNDDMLLNSPVSPDYYFHKGLPCDCNAEKPFQDPIYSHNGKFSNRISVYCNVAVLNCYFDRQQVIKQAKWKWYGPHLWGKYFVSTLLMWGRRNFCAFVLRHYELPMLKSVFSEIWDKEYELANMSCGRFRQDVSFTNYIVRYWQFATNRFHPVRNKFGKYFNLGVDSIDEIRETILSEKCKSVCLNDSPHCSDEDYVSQKVELHKIFELKYPSKSSFEL